MWLADLFKSSPGKRFFDLLAHQAAFVREAAQTLVRYVETGSPELAATVEDLEHRGDEELLRLIEAIADTFVTPLDRQDLYNLGGALDDRLHYLARSAREIQFFEAEPTSDVRATAG